LTKKWNKEFLLGATSITEGMHVSEIGSVKRWRRKEKLFMFVLGNV